MRCAPRPPGPRLAHLRFLSLAAAFALASGCGLPPWSDAQRAQAFRMCRGPIPLGPIDVFREDGRAFATFMCNCQVDYLSTRVPYDRLYSPIHVEEVNGVLADARAACLQRHRHGER